MTGQKPSLVVQDDLIQIPAMFHHETVAGTGEKGDVGFRKSIAERPKKRDNTQHIAQLVMLPYDEDASKRRIGRQRPFLRTKKEAEHGAEKMFERALKKPHAGLCRHHSFGGGS
jgi:hypothetical protein